MGASPSDETRDASRDRVIERGFAPDAVEVSHELTRLQHRVFGAPEPKLSRYVLLERIGSGGMGVVYAARDPELDRKVALKVLKAAGPDRPQTESRLLREARALARLSHPSVVPVYDVGIADGRVFMAMELVSGRTLSEWLNEERRDWRNVVDVFLHAGAGLVAAHDSGLVHRDFKPQNVLVGDDGRVRVADFGLAVDAGSLASADFPSDDPRFGRSTDSPSTSSNALMGTPSYMAPEQFAGAEVDALADQFSFCVALYSAVFGAWPFRRDDEPIADSVCRGELAPAPPDAHVPGRLRRALTRGLSVERSARWPSMQSLLDELRATRYAARRRWLLFGAGLVASWGAFVAFGGSEVEPECGGSAARLADVWDDSRRAQVRAAFTRSGLGYADDLADRVVTQLDEHASAWVKTRDRACGASPVVLDLRMQCLEARRRELTGLVDVFAAADAHVVSKAADAADKLTPVEDCSDDEQLARSITSPSDPELARTVGDVRLALVDARALEMAGKYAEGLEAAAQVAVAAEATGYAPLVAEAQLRLASLLAARGRIPEAEAAFERAALEGIAVKHDELAAAAMARLVGIVGFRQGRFEDGLAWARYGESVLKRLRPDHPTEAQLLSNVGLVLNLAGRTEEAIPFLERALALRTRLHGPNGPGAALVVSNLGNLSTRLGRYERALEYHLRSLAMWEENYGSLHPFTTIALDNAGNVHQLLGHYRTATAFHQRGLAAAERTHGVDSHVHVAALLGDLANDYFIVGDYEAASRLNLRAVEILSTLAHRRHRNLGRVLNNLGGSELMADRPDIARRYFERAVAVNRRVRGSEHPSVAVSIGGLGAAALATGDREAARFHMVRAIGMLEREGEESDLADQILQLAKLLSAGGDRHAARSALERVVSLVERSEPSGHPKRARIEFAAARELWTGGTRSDRLRAHELAQSAARQLAATPEPPEASLGEVRTWLARHQSP